MNYAQVEEKRSEIVKNGVEGAYTISLMGYIWVNWVNGNRKLFEISQRIKN